MEIGASPLHYDVKTLLFIKRDFACLPNVYVAFVAVSDWWIFCLLGQASDQHGLVDFHLHLAEEV